MKGGLGQLMRQAQQMQADMQKAQEELANLEVNGTAGGGMVTVTMTCRHQVRGVSIDDSMIGDDREMLEDLVAAAVNDAVRKVEQTVQERFSGMTAGLNLPPGMKLPG
jgi:DNA-binding YbaB/EbfC family protein